VRTSMEGKIGKKMRTMNQRLYMSISPRGSLTIKNSTVDRLFLTCFIKRVAISYLLENTTIVFLSGIYKSKGFKKCN
jgi:hypothetical protein